jgi:energy-coupling factor transport system permease protein
MIFLHPVCLFISLASALSYSIYLSKSRAVRFSLRYMLPLLLITAILNPVFNHEGVTIIAYLRSGNPLTLESIIYGVAASLMLITVITWFSCYNAVMTRISSSTSSANNTRTFIGTFYDAALCARFKAQLKVVSGAQKCVGTM